MKTTNALVTYTDLSTMGLPPKGTPATGDRIATKSFIVANYYVDESASPFSTYTPLRCPPYQTIIAGSVVSLSVTPGCAGGEGTGTVLANGFSGGTGSFEYITISDISSGDALTKLDNPATRTFIGGATEYTFTGLGNATYYVAIMDYSGNKGVSTGAVVNCITTTTTTSSSTSTTTTTTSTSTSTSTSTTTTTTTTAPPLSITVSGANSFFGGEIVDITVNSVTISGVSFPINIGDGFSGTTSFSGVQTVQVYVQNVSPNGCITISADTFDSFNVGGDYNVAFTTNINGGVYINCTDGSCV